MSFINRYIAYLRDNPEHYWFKRKIFGWGWVPATWQGFAILVAWIVLFAYLIARFAAEPVPRSGRSAFIAEIIVAGVILIAICFAKGERPKWQWGFPSDSSTPPPQN